MVLNPDPASLKCSFGSQSALRRERERESERKSAPPSPSFLFPILIPKAKVIRSSRRSPLIISPLA